MDIRNILCLNIMGLFLLVFPLSGQEVAKKMVNYKFTDGVYLNIEQVKANSPILKAKLLSSTNYNDKDFFKNLFKLDKIYYYDDIGIRQEIAKSSVWGYARNGVLYIQVEGSFNRITFVGSICHFVAEVTAYDSRYYDSPYGYGYPYSSYYSPYYYSPYYYSPYYYSPYYYSPYYYSPYGYGGYGYPYYPSSYLSRSEIRQYIIDFETGDILDFTLDNVKRVLMKDADLYSDFIRLRHKKQKDNMFVYIRKYNERHPLQLSDNKNNNKKSF